jgi:regulator of extracellular matrix RemA (YlzA/DUF370 family)
MWMLVGGSRPIPVLVPESVVIERMIASAEKYGLLSNLSAASEATRALPRGPVEPGFVDE